MSKNYTHSTPVKSTFSRRILTPRETAYCARKTPTQHRLTSTPSCISTLASIQHLRVSLCRNECRRYACAAVHKGYFYTSREHCAAATRFVPASRKLLVTEHTLRGWPDAKTAEQKSAFAHHYAGRSQGERTHWPYFDGQV